MRAADFIEEIRKEGDAPDITCDTVKCGDPEKEIKRVAVSMFATVRVIKNAAEWGADMLLVHEPTFYDHLESGEKTPVTEAKSAILKESCMLLYRHHDRMHSGEVDGIAEGELYYLGLRGKLEKTEFFGSYLFVLDTPLSPLELKGLMKERLNIKYVMIAGEKQKKAKVLALCFGAPAGIFELMKDERVDSVIVGEVCQWQVAEYARDAAELGFNKSLIVMGHIGSERDGMRYMTEKLKKAYADMDFKYFDCEEVYGEA